MLYFYFFLFFISGAAALIYESVWSHYLRLYLGHAAYSQVLVLVIYMGGMAVGSWIAAKHSHKIKKLLPLYAIIEILLAVAAIFFHDIFESYLAFSFGTVLPSLNIEIGVMLYKWITASLLILPQTILLGATFPIMASGILRKYPSNDGYKVSVLYFINSLGASFGVLFSGFYMISKVGLPGTIIFGGIMDFTVGLAILIIWFVTSDIKSKEEIQREITPIKATATEKDSQYYMLLVISGATAAASFMYQIGWIRMLNLVLGSSTHAFELMLSAFILGLALGGFFIRKRLDSIKDTAKVLAIVQIIMGATAIFTLVTYGHMFEFMRFMHQALAKTDQGYIMFNILSHVICMVTMLPSTICAGMVVPLIIHSFFKRGYGEDTIGKVYAVNTFGGILGVIAAAVFVMPILGLRMVVFIGGTVDILIGVFIFWKFVPLKNSFAKFIISPACITFLIFMLMTAHLDTSLMSSGVFRHGRLARARDILYHKDGRTATVTLFQSGGSLTLSTNGKPDASVNITGGYSGDEFTMAMLGVIPMAIKEDAKNAAVIGMGAGMTSHFMLYDPGFEYIDIIEIEPAMAEAAEMMGPKVANTFTDPRARVFFDDAKSFFAGKNRRYDIIVSEPSNPWVSGVATLFSKEFFGLIKNYLTEDGILVQWFHLYEAHISLLASILEALEMHFPNYEIYHVNSDIIIVASPNPDSDISIKRDLFEIAPLAYRLTDMGFNSMDEIKITRSGSNFIYGVLTDSYDYPANSDYHPFVDLTAVKHRFLGNNVFEVDNIKSYIVPVRKILESDTAFLDIDGSKMPPGVHNIVDFYRAKAIYRQFVLGEKPSEDDEKIYDFADTKLDFEQIATFSEQISTDMWLVPTANLLNKTLPYLSKSEMIGIWGYIESKTAAINFTGYDSLWRDFFRGLCYYDMELVRATSYKLLPEDGIIADHYLNHILMVALFVSSYKTENHEGLMDIWERYEVADDPPIMARIAKNLVLPKQGDVNRTN